MSERDLSGIRFTGERERIISGALALAVSDWAERTHTAEYQGFFICHIIVIQGIIRSEM